MSWPGKAKAATLITVNVGWLVVPFLLGFWFFFCLLFLHRYMMSILFRPHLTVPWCKHFVQFRCEIEILLFYTRTH